MPGKLERKIQELEDIREIERVVARYQYYHTAMKWAEGHDLTFARDADTTFLPFGSVIRGHDQIRAAWSNGLKSEVELNQKHLAKRYPGESLPADAGLRYEHAMTTPIIEVAEDGKTAKGVWISPGYVSQPTETGTNTLWGWHRYAIDFIKEDGAWKIWHHHIYSEFTSPHDQSWVERSLSAVTNESEVAPDGERTDDTPYSPFEARTLAPRLPEPYRSFDKTFSYANIVKNPAGKKP